MRAGSRPPSPAKKESENMEKKANSTRSRVKKMGVGEAIDFKAGDVRLTYLYKLAWELRADYGIRITVRKMDEETFRVTRYE